MVMTNKLKEAFDVESKHGAFYTGGNVEWHDDSTIYCQTDSAISSLNTENGLVTRIVVGVDETNDPDSGDLIQTFTSNDDRLVTSHKSGLLKLWNKAGELMKQWKSIHKGPVVRLRLIENDRLASGGADGTIRIWDLTHQACTLNLKSAECQGVMDVVEYYPDNNCILASGDDGKIACWDLIKGNLTMIYARHYSKVTAIVMPSTKQSFVSAGRDKVIILWQFSNTEPIRIIPVSETIETLVSLPVKFKLPNSFKSELDRVYVATGGENAIVRIWDLTNSREIYQQTNSLVAKQTGGITRLICNENLRHLIVISADHNIIIHNLKSFVCLKQFIGFQDEILDLALVGRVGVPNSGFLAVATNSNDIKLYDNSTMNCQLLKGHNDIVMALASSPINTNLLLSSSKDNTVRLWRLIDDATMDCIGIGNRHTNSIGSVAFFNQTANHFVSVSQDCCMKLWELPTVLKTTTNLNCLQTEVAHNKDINCVTIAPNDKIIATASQDKTAKFWSPAFELIGTLKGHKRGIWSIRFSPVDQVVVTSSADCTIKLWSVTSLSCLKTIEGHESSVLKAEFISNGLQIVSAGADGLIKLFSIKSSECVCTLDEHDARVWALLVQNDESGLISGGSDSILIKWKDVTEERVLARLKDEHDMVLEEQKLNNYLQNDDLLKALTLALKLDRPAQVLKIIQKVIKTGIVGLNNTIDALREDQKESLMKCLINWNTNSRNCQAAQLVLNILINQIQSGDFKPVHLSGMIESTLPYTERHFKRLTQLMQDLNFINYTVNCMQPHAK